MTKVEISCVFQAKLRKVFIHMPGVEDVRLARIDLAMVLNSYANQLGLQFATVHFDQQIKENVTEFRATAFVRLEKEKKEDG